MVSIKGALNKIGYISLKACFLKEFIIIAAQIRPDTPLKSWIWILLFNSTFHPLIKCKANKTGIKTLALDCGFHEKERLIKGNPYRIYSSFQDLSECLY